MIEGRATRIGVGLAAGLVIAFLWLPLVVIVLYAFSSSHIPSWPITSYSTRWFREAWHDQAARDAFVLSIKVALGATGVALLLGSAAAFAIHRFRFFGREAVSFLVVLPIALPGIVTGMALLSMITYGNFTASILTIIIGHATFCIVVVYNNVLARLRRSSASLEEASMDLGADGWLTFRYVTLPAIATALVAGALLAFALSFDEIVVTYFTAGAEQTLPLWIFNQFRLPNKQPEVNAVAVVVILFSFIPVALAQRLMRNTGGITR